MHKHDSMAGIVGSGKAPSSRGIVGIDGRPLDRLPVVLISTPYYDHTHDIYDQTFDDLIAGQGQFFHVIRHLESTSAIDVARNNAVKIARENHADYVMFADADMGFPVGTLIHLLAAMETSADERPMVTSGVYCIRRQSFVYAVYNRYGDAFASVSELPESGFKLNDGIYKADACGAGCMLIRTELFDRLEFPYFQFWYKPMVVGGEILRWSEDLVFGMKCCEIGVHVFVNTRLLCKHLVRNCAVFPDGNNYAIEIENNRWSFGGEK